MPFRIGRSSGRSAAARAPAWRVGRGTATRSDLGLRSPFQHKDDNVIKSTMTTTTAPTRSTSAPRKRGDDTRAKIIDETVRCIAEEGFAAATAKHVAERAGVTWGVIQYHFGDRNGLLIAVVDDGVSRLVESLSTVDVGDLPLPARLATVVDIAWDCYS